MDETKEKIVSRPASQNQKGPREAEPEEAAGACVVGSHQSQEKTTEEGCLEPILSLPVVPEAYYTLRRLHICISTT